MLALTRLVTVLPALFVSSAFGAALSPFPPLYQLLAGQTSSINPTTIPSQCTSRCNLAVTIVNSCQNSTNPTCGCSLAVESGYVDCLNCLISLSPSQTLISTEQQYVDQFVAVCDSYGASLPSTSLAPVVAGSTTASNAPGATSPPGPTSSMTVASSVNSQSTVTTLTAPPTPSSGTSKSSGSSTSSLPATTTRSAASRGTGNASKGVAIAVFAAVIFTLFL